MMIKVAAISYLNSVPLVWGIQQQALQAQLVLAEPATCAAAFKNHEVDVALVPVGTLDELPDAIPVTDFCIGASGKVRSVVVMSNEPLHNIKRILLDTHSRTSARLARLLCKHHWNIAPAFAPLAKEPEAGEAVMLIGDRVFPREGQFKYTWDLAREWRAMTGLPFVFAVWVARQKVPPSWLAQLNAALAWGVEHVEEAVATRQEEYALDYLTKNIDYRFDTEKKEALRTFKNLCHDYDIHAPTQQHRAADRAEQARGAGH